MAQPLTVRLAREQRRELEEARDHLVSAEALGSRQNVGVRNYPGHGRVMPAASSLGSDSLNVHLGGDGRIRGTTAPQREDLPHNLQRLCQPKHNSRQNP